MKIRYTVKDLKKPCIRAVLNEKKAAEVLWLRKGEKIDETSKY